MLARAVEAVTERLVVEDARLDRVTVGESAVLVELTRVGERPAAGTSRSSGAGAGGSTTDTAGLAYRPSGSRPPVPSDVETALGWIDLPADERVRRAVGIATLNALSAPRISWRRGDPMALLEPAVDVITTVGLFAPALRRFSSVEVRVVERRSDRSLPETADSVDVSLYDPSAADRAIDGADVVFVTGSTLVYGGLERYLAATSADQTVVLIGATASFVPSAAFADGVDVLAGATVTDPDRVREAVRAGACGSALHDADLEKGFVCAPHWTGESLKGVAGEGTGDTDGDPATDAGTSSVSPREGPP